MGKLYVTKEALIAHLFGYAEGSEALRRLLIAPACAHHLAPNLTRIADQRGLAPKIYLVLGDDRLAALNISLSSANFRLYASKAAEGLTLDVIFKIFTILQAFLALDPADAHHKFADTRSDLIARVGDPEPNNKPGKAFSLEGLVTESALYVEMAEAPVGRQSDHLISIPMLMRRWGIAANDFETLCTAADPGRGRIYVAALRLLNGLQQGYMGKDRSQGACKLTIHAADFLYEVLKRAAAVLSGRLDHFELIFSDHPDIGPRKGQATRSLSLINGNITKPFVFGDQAPLAGSRA